MKKMLFMLLIIGANLAYAQKTQITEVTESIGGGSNPAYSVFIENVDPKKAEKEWNNFIREYNGKSTSSRDLKNQVIFENVKIAAVGTEPLKVYAKIFKNADAIRITAAFAKPGSFISSNTDPSADNAVKKLMYNFAVNFKKKLVAEEIEAANEVQNKNRENLKSLQKIVDTNTKNITLYETKIATARQDITRDSTAIEQLKMQMATQDSLLQVINQKLKDIN